ncbi:MAG: D-aminoacyl-tRNA deacylase [Anaerovoracaceae bacterium]
MRIVVQRITRGQVICNDRITGAIESGLLLFVGVTHTDQKIVAEALADKIVNLRIFEDDAGKMNLSLLDVGGEILSVSQFTLYADIRKGRRPSFTDAAKPELAEDIYDFFNEELRKRGVVVKTGCFGGLMDVDFVNSGPVTIIIDSEELA